MKRYLYRRTIKKAKTPNGKPVRAWYYWYFDPNNPTKRIRKSCGTSKEPVLFKAEAEAIIEKLEEKDREYLAIRAEKESVTIAKLADAMFGYDESAYIRRRQGEGYMKDEETLKDIRRYLKKFIVKNYGHLKPEEIDPVKVDYDLMSVNRSSEWRKRNVSILNWILDEAIWLKMIKYKPVLKTYRVLSKNKSILSRDEIDKCFPDDFEELSRIWGEKNTPSEEGFMFGVLFALIASAGLRSAESRAINPSQLLVSDGVKIAKLVGPDGREAVNPLGETKKEHYYGLLLDRMFKKSGKIVNHLKKGNDEENKKMRIELIPEKTVRYLKHWLTLRPTLDSETDLLFPYKGRKPRKRGIKYGIDGGYLIRRFKSGLKNAGISTENRKLTPHSLRYTYNTKMRDKLSDEKLRNMMGHETEGMTDYYTVITMQELQEKFLGLQESSTTVNSFWGNQQKIELPSSEKLAILETLSTEDKLAAWESLPSDVKFAAWENLSQQKLYVEAC